MRHVEAIVCSTLPEAKEGVRASRKGLLLVAWSELTDHDYARQSS